MPLTAPGQTPEDIVRIDTSLVQLNIGVADQQGRPITDLQTNNFTVYEDGVRQNPMSFESTTTPFSLALLLDMSGSTLSFRQNIKLAAWRFIDALAPEDRVAVIGFNEPAELLTKFTADRPRNFVTSTLFTTRLLIKRETDAFGACQTLRESKTMLADFFLDVVDEHYPDEEAERQFATAVDWGRYAELFEYVAEEKRLTITAEE